MLTARLPESVAAAYEFMTGPLLDNPYRVGKRLLPPLDDRFSARRGTYEPSTARGRQADDRHGGRCRTSRAYRT
nr:hypothetical protein [Nocardia sp. BMG51109]